MVGVLIKIKLATVRNTLSGTRRALMIIGGVVGLILAASTTLLCITQNGSSGSVNFLCLIFLLWTLGWALGPMLTGGDGTLRPEYFRTLPSSPQQLALGLFVASLVSVPSLVSLLAFGGLIGYAIQLGILPTAVAAVATILQLALVVLLARVLGRVVGQAMQSRIGMELGALVMGILIAFLNVGWYAVPAMAQAVSSQSPAFSTTVRLSPSGWAVVAVDAASHHTWWQVVAALLGLTLLCGLLFLVWSHLLVRGATTAVASTTAVHPYRRRRLLAATPVGAVVSRELHTWWRDPVRGRFLRMALWLGVWLGLLLALAGGNGLLPWIGPLTVILMTALASNIYGFDGSALWLTLTTPHAERTDVRGRQLAWFLIVAPCTVTLTCMFAVLSGQSWAWWVAAALLPALLGCGAGVLVLSSVLRLVPVTDPHRRGRSSIIASEDMDVGELQVEGLLALALMLVTVAPVCVLMLLGTVAQRADVQWVSIAAGIGTGLLSAWWFGRLAYQRVGVHGPELLNLMTKGNQANSS